MWVSYLYWGGCYAQRILNADPQRAKPKPYSLKSCGRLRRLRMIGPSEVLESFSPTKNLGNL